VIKRLIGCLIALGLASPAFAQSPTTTLAPSAASPRLAFCFGQSTICVVPDFGLQTISYNLKAKAWSTGITTLGAGYALLFASDKPYASGVAIHASFNVGQTGSSDPRMSSSPSYFAPTFALVGFHWFEVGYTPVFMDGQIGQRLTLGANLNAEALVTLITGERLLIRRAALERISPKTAP
jgi:hypothetical protein